MHENVRLRENHGIIILNNDECFSLFQINYNNNEHVLISDNKGDKMKIPHILWQKFEEYIIAKAKAK